MGEYIEVDYVDEIIEEEVVQGREDQEVVDHLSHANARHGIEHGY